MGVADVARTSHCLMPMCRLIDLCALWDVIGKMNSL
jgi:hypothetical protein